MPPKISVIVLAYNVGRYIQSCLESVREQTFKDFEMIIVDDGSDDETPTLIDAAKRIDKRIISVQHPTNQGTFRARITGADHARGDYFCMVDGDDVIEPGYLQTLYTLARHEERDILECGMMAAIANGQVRVVPRCELSPSRANGVDILHLALKGHIWHTASNKLVSRDLYLKARAYLAPIKDHITIADDKLFMLPVLFFARSFARTDRILYWYRERAESSTRMRSESSDLKNIDSTGTADCQLKEIFGILSPDSLTHELLKFNRREEIRRCLRLLERHTLGSTSRNLLEAALRNYYETDLLADEERSSKNPLRRFFRVFFRYNSGTGFRLLWRSGWHTLWGLVPGNRRRVMNMIRPRGLANNSNESL
jgi:glycosyltransferase involved in cell wall biosynthesis